MRPLCPFLPLATAVAVMPAFAQDSQSPAQLPATVVVGQKEPGVKAANASVGSLGEAPILDTPASVSVFTRALMDAQRAALLTDVVLNDPSVIPSYAPAGYYDLVNIRGFELDIFNSYRINGMRISHDAPVALENKERIEILKGLGAVESGFARPGGIVNYVTKRPTSAPFVALELDYDRWHAGREHVDFGGPIDPAGNVAYRINLANESLRSYAYGANGKRQFGSLALDWRIAPRVRIELDSEYQERSQLTVPGFNLLDGTTVPQNVDPRVLMNDQPWRQPWFVRTATFQGRLFVDLAPDWTAIVSTSYMKRKADDYVSFPFGFSGNYDYDVYDYRSIDEKRNPHTVEALIRGSFGALGLRHDVAFGASAYRNDIRNPDYVYNFAGVSNYFRPVAVPPAPEPLTPAVSYRQKENAVFAQDTLSFGPSWKLVLAGRETQVERHASGLVEFDWKKSVFSPNAALLYKPLPQMTAYVSYAKGLEQGDPAPLGTTNQNQVLDPLDSRQVEAGLKWDVRPDFNVQTAVFRIEKPLEYIDATNTWVQNGTQRHTGVEVNVAGRATPDLSLFGGITLMDPVQESTGDPTRDGRQKANIAKRRAALWAEYAVPGAPGLVLDARWQYASRRPVTDDNSVWVSGYSIYGVGARYSTRIHGHPTTFGFTADNVFDKNYWKDVGQGYLHLGAPRTWNFFVQTRWP